MFRSTLFAGPNNVVFKSIGLQKFLIGSNEYIYIYITLLIRLSVIFHIADYSALPFLSGSNPFLFNPNNWILSFFHCHERIPRGRFWFLGYRSQTAQIHLWLYVNLMTYPDNRNFCPQYYTITSFTLLSNYLALDDIYIYIYIRNFIMVC